MENRIPKHKKSLLGEAKEERPNNILISRDRWIYSLFIDSIQMIEKMLWFCEATMFVKYHIFLEANTFFRRVNFLERVVKLKKRFIDLKIDFDDAKIFMYI